MTLGLKFPPIWQKEGKPRFESNMGPQGISYLTEQIIIVLVSRPPNPNQKVCTR